MELHDPLDIFAYQLGSVWGRLLSLETLLRLAISRGNFKVPFDARPGDEVEADELNRLAWAYMSELVAEYNAAAAKEAPQNVLAAGDEIVLVRNALAYGIAISTSPATALRLIKFGKKDPKTQRISIDFIADMTLDWLEQQQRTVQKAVDTVVSYIKAKGIGQPNT